MKLVRLILENIKSYSEESINFYDGVNFISGFNGAGKTTIIEAVGYALFDSNPFSTQKQFIKKGEKSGTITVVVEAIDERLYRIVRRLREPSGGSWAVYDEESGMELNELHGNQDVRAWLATNLGIGKGLDPVRLFEDVIGISQGKFISPFLERPKDRKKIFNTILQLESYREAFDKSSSIASVLKDRISEKHSEKKVLMSKIEDLEECRRRLKENQNKATELEQRFRKLTSELALLEEQIQIQEKYRVELEKSQQELHKLGIRLATLFSRKESLQVQVEEAELNKKKVAQAEVGYREYEAQKQTEKSLEEKRKKRDLINNKMQELKHSIVSLQTEIKSNKENREKQIKQLQIDIEEIAREGEKVSAQRAQVEKKHMELKSGQLKLAQNKESFAFLQQALNLAEQCNATLKVRLDSYQQLLVEKESIQGSLEGWAEKEKRAAGVADLEKKLNRIREELNKNQARLISLNENSQATKNGKCPFLEMPCLNVEGNLQEHFNREIEAITPIIEQLRNEEINTSKEVFSAKVALEEFHLLQHQKKQLERLKAQENDVLDILITEREVLMQSIHPRNIQPLYQALVNTKEYFLKTGIELDSEMSLIEEKVQEQLDGYADFYTHTFVIQEWQNANRILVPLLSTLTEMKGQADAFWKRVEYSFNRYSQEINSNLATYDTKIGTMRERYRRLKEQINAINNDNLLLTKEKELQVKEQEMSVNTEQQKDYIGLEEKWQKNQEMITKNEADYIQYMQNIESIRKYEALNIDLQKAISDETHCLKEEGHFKEALMQLQKLYNPELLLELRSRSNKMSEEKGGIGKELDHAVQEVEVYSCQVREKEKVLVEIINLDKEISRENKAQELLRLARLILNQSGEGIAELYRQHLGREANYIYQQIAKENVTLYWGDDYELKIIEMQDEKENGRVFTQLSGGEKMTSALAVRLALLKQLSGLGIGFFDEPTANLDEQRRGNLARIIPQVTKAFRQLFVISHDDTFDSITENVIHLKKDSTGTKVVK
ncbi:MAG: hypothetical protein CVU87_13410 [Firmicutes bacterium HGW-Firmicutes-12]|jgi:exonuclease SbcC|nr:MAG: hypothetical protein CVU87_13410 [Firmicutes bacterium HGW-Firmicutes-12]